MTAHDGTVGFHKNSGGNYLRRRIWNECTLVYPYFDNPHMLSAQVDAWNAYPPKIRRRVAVIVVDDHSVVPPIEILRGCGIEIVLLRFATPGLWTMHEARNLGAQYSSQRWPHRWLLMSDIDHIITGKYLSILLTRTLRQTNHYTFNRLVGPSMGQIAPHKNSFMVHPEIYEKLNGYDIDLYGLYGGGYGGDDVFVAQLSNIAPRVHLKKCYSHCVQQINCRRGNDYMGSY